MKLPISFCSFIFLLVAMLACQSEAEQARPLQSLTFFENANFDPAKADSLIAVLEDKERLAFYTALLDKPNNKMPIIDEWLVQQITDIVATWAESPPEAIYNLANRIHVSDFPQAGFLIAKQLVAYARETNDKELEGLGLVLLTDYYALEYKQDSLALYLEQLKPIALSLTESPNRLRRDFHQNQAYFHTLSGTYFDAIVNYSYVLDWLSAEDTLRRTEVYHDLALVYLKLEWYDKAEGYVDMLLELLGIEHLDISLINTAAIIYSKNGNFDQANVLFQRIINQPKENFSPSLLAQSYSNYGNLLRKMKQYEGALLFMGKSDSVAQEIGLEIGEVMNGINRAEVYFDIQQLDAALAEIQSLETIIQDYQNPDIESSWNELLYRIYDKKGDLDLANAYYRKYHSMRDETAGEEPKNLISAWELSLAREKSMAEQRELQSAIEQKDRRFYRISFLLTLIILLLVILIFYISRRNQAVKNQALLYEQKIKHDLELDSKELIAESVRNVSVQAVKSSMYADVKRIIEKLPKTNQKLFDKFFQSEHMLGEDLVLEEFDKRFVGVYEDFYQGIQQIAPDLTAIELRVCAFIRLNCSTKEIAMLMSRSVGRIENIRIAIRKKLKLAKDDDLQQFLLKF